MKNYKQVAESVFRKSEERIRIIEKRRAKIRRTVYAVSGMCAALIIGVGLWKNAAVKDAFRKDYHSSSIIENTSEADHSVTEKAYITANSSLTTTSVQISASYVTAPDVSLQQPVISAVTDKKTKQQNFLTEPVSGDIKEPVTTSYVAKTGTTPKPQQNTVTFVRTTLTQTETCIETTSLQPSSMKQVSEIITTTYEAISVTEHEHMPVTESPVSNTEASLCTVTHPPTEDDTLSFVLNEVKYSYSGKELDEMYYGSFMQEVPFTYKTAKAYTINGISKKAAIALEFGGNGVGLIYTNKKYKPDSLSAMISDLSLESCVQTGVALCDQWGETSEYQNISPRGLLQKLSEYNVQQASDPPQLLNNDMLRITAHHSLLNRDVRISVTNSGYVYIELQLYNKFVFHIGENEADKLIEQINSEFQNN